MATTDRPKCVTCAKCAKEFGHLSPVWECRARPPVPNTMSDNQHLRAVWPIVNPHTDWCDKHQPIGNPDVNC